MMKRPWVLRILLVLLLAGIILPGYSYGEILFEDNFDNHPDWSPKQPAYPSSIECWLPDHLVKDALVPPDGYFAYRIGGSYFTNQGHNTFNIDSTNYRGASGKGLTYWNESDSRFWASDADLFVLLDPAGIGYKEIYMRFYVKFKPGWRWSTNNSPIQKFFRATHYTGSGNPFSFFSMGNHHPAFVGDFAKYGIGTYPITYTASYRYENVYYPHQAMPPTVDTDNFFFYEQDGNTTKDFWDEGMLGDGNWHCWESYLKMNSDIGVPDGEHKFWLDGKLIGERKDLAWSDETSIVIGSDGLDYSCILRHKAADSNKPIFGVDWQKYWQLAGSTGKGTTWKVGIDYGFSTINPRSFWNMIGIGGNNVNHYAPNSEEAEQWYAIDDLVVSTEYIGPEYVIGGISCDINGDGFVNVQDVQVCVNVILGLETQERFVNKIKVLTDPQGECTVSDLQRIVNVILGV